jgi:hypothetical protein
MILPLRSPKKDPERLRRSDRPGMNEKLHVQFFQLLIC